MKQKIDQLLRDKVHTRDVPEFDSGDRIRITTREEIGGQMRTRHFEGICIARSGTGPNETVKLRKESFGVGVERIFPLQSSIIESIDVLGRGDVRRSKLNYLEGRSSRDARIEQEQVSQADESAEETESTTDSSDESSETEESTVETDATEASTSEPDQEESPESDEARAEESVSG